mgnify:CR=1 FL=1
MKEIFQRVSVRKFTAQEVEADKVELLLRAAMAAPSAGNQQPWTFCVVRDRALLDRLSEASPYAKPLLGAPLCIAVTGLGHGLRFPEYWQQDLGACTQNLLLEAEHLGLGAVWMGIAPLEERMQAVRGVLGLEEESKPFCLIAVGYPAERAAGHDRYDPSRVKMM